MYKAYLYSAIFLLASSCSYKQKSPARNNEIKKISFIAGSCYGECPEITIEIDSSLTYKFHGGNYSQKQGFYRGKVTQSFWDSINAKLERAYYKQRGERYEYGYHHPRLLQLIIHYQDKQKTISGNFQSIPQELRDALEWLENSYPYVDLYQTDSLKFEARLGKTEWNEEEFEAIKKEYERFRDNLGRPDKK